MKKGDEKMENFTRELETYTETTYQLHISSNHQTCIFNCFLPGS